MFSFLLLLAEEEGVARHDGNHFKGEMGGGKQELGVTAILAYGRGMRQFTQLDILDKFADEFFEKIERLAVLKLFELL